MTNTVVNNATEEKTELISVFDKKNSKIIFLYTLFWSLTFLIATPIVCILSGEGMDIFKNFFLILTSPSKLVTDYFDIGGPSSTLLNAGLCGLACNLVTLFSKSKSSSNVLAGYFLVIAHCFYGLNLINMWPTFCGVYVYCLATRKKFSDNLHIAMFATSLAPFVSDFLFRYTLGDEFVFGQVRVTIMGFVLAIAFGIAAGFIVPALLPGTTKMHRGFNLYKAGLAIGLLGCFIFAFMYETLGLTAPEAIVRGNELYAAHEFSYAKYMNVIFIFVFASSILAGYLMNGKSFHGYKKLLRSTGHGVDFSVKYGMPTSLINIGVYGLLIVLYLNIIFLLTDGVGYTGATAGVTIAAITFSASGQNPRNVWPIVLGYAALYVLASALCSIIGLELPWSLSSQGYINGLAFATGLCPFTGKYGWRIGMIAGFMCAIICTSTLAMHGGFVLYNGGLTAGLTALILIPILDFYNVKEKFKEQD